MGDRFNVATLPLHRAHWSNLSHRWAAGQPQSTCSGLRPPAVRAPGSRRPLRGDGSSLPERMPLGPRLSEKSSAADRRRQWSRAGVRGTHLLVAAAGAGAVARFLVATRSPGASARAAVWTCHQRHGCFLVALFSPGRRARDLSPCATSSRWFVGAYHDLLDYGYETHGAGLGQASGGRSWRRPTCSAFRVLAARAGQEDVSARHPRAWSCTSANRSGTAAAAVAGSARHLSPARPAAHATRMVGSGFRSSRGLIPTPMPAVRTIKAITRRRASTACSPT